MIKKNPHLRGRRKRITADFFSEIIQARRKWSVVEEHKHQTRVQYPVKLSFNSEGEIQTFSDKQKLELISSRPALQEMFKRVLVAEEKCYRLEIVIYIFLKRKRIVTEINEGTIELQ